MKNFGKILLLTTLAWAGVASAASTRTLDGQQITNGSATLIIPTTSDTLAGVTQAQSFTNKTIDGTLNTLTNIQSSSLSSVTLNVANGGTGQTTLPANALVAGNGTGAVATIAVGSQYQVLQGNASGLPSYGAVQLGQSNAVSGQLGLSNGGTGASTQSGAANAVLPSQTAQNGNFLTTNGTVVSWASVPTSTPNVVGSTGSPTAITAVGGVSFSGSNYTNINFITGSGGAVTVTASPQIAAGSAVGQKLQLIGESNTNTVKLQDGTGLSLNGAWVGALQSVLNLTWDGSTWVENSRR